MKTKETRTRNAITKFLIRTVLCGISSLGLLVTATSSFAQGSNGNGMFHDAQVGSEQHATALQSANTARRPLRINSNFPQVRSVAASLPREATHLIVRSDADARQI